MVSGVSHGWVSRLLRFAASTTSRLTMERANGLAIEVGSHSRSSIRLRTACQSSGQIDFRDIRAASAAVRRVPGRIHVRRDSLLRRDRRVPDKTRRPRPLPRTARWRRVRRPGHFQSEPCSSSYK